MRLARSEGAVAATVDGQLVVLSPGMEFVALDRMGEVIWDLLAEPRSVDEIVTALTSRFEVETARCRTDVEVFTAQLRERGLVADLAS